MNSRTLAARLLRGGFSIRDAGDIVMWMAEPFKYNPWDGLLELEEMAREIDDEELIVPQPYYGELLYLRKKEEERKRRSKDRGEIPYRGLSVGQA